LVAVAYGGVDKLYFVGHYPSGKKRSNRSSRSKRSNRLFGTRK
jgi:hypothetical protein